MYPDELDCLIGDAMLLKVAKRDVYDVDSKEYAIVDVLTDPFILDYFFKIYMPTYGVFDGVARELSPLKMYDALSSPESESFIEVSSNYKRKRQLEIFPQSVGCNDTIESLERKTPFQTIHNPSAKFGAALSPKCCRSV
jgi:hypothetical protein